MTKKLTLEEMQQIAKDRGGTCLSTEYVNAMTKLRWRCAKGHEWESAPAYVKQGTWCPDCGKTKKLTLKDMQGLAHERGGECLSEEYVNTKTKMEWRCNNGHTWKAVPTNIRKGRWCPECGKITGIKYPKLSIEQMRKIAKENGGECLSDEYINNKTHLTWRCNEGHEWDAYPQDIIRGSWCPDCAGNFRLTIHDMKKLAQTKGGECLSKKYINAKTHLKWRCIEGHEWEAVPASVRSGRWCPYCAKKVKSTIEEMQELARSRSGECLSTEYQATNKLLKWKCVDGHEWEAIPSDIKGGHWCPECTVHVSERICREMFERIFDKKFPKRKPEWLLNPETGKKMELDGFCKELNLAFEYQGQHHYKVTGFSTEELLIKQIERDKLKREICDENDVILIEVPYNIEYEDFPKYIITECKNREIEVPHVRLDAFDYRSFNIYSPGKLEKLQKKAEERGGRCLSDAYINSKTPLKWQCKKGHIWETAPVNINQGQWCPNCGHRVPSIDEFKRIAKERGGECLSDEYIHSHEKLKWKCSEGHEWDALPSAVRRGTWCPNCAGTTRLTIELMHDIAKSRGGECLSEVYVQALKKLKWKCNKGHEWEAAPSDIKKGTWCPICAKTSKVTIEDMKKLANERDGECLSKTYKNAMTKLTWKCSEGHVWDATPAKVKYGSWCPICGRMGEKK